MIEVNDLNFKSEVLESNIPVLVDFYTTWCPPCKVMAKVLEAEVSKYEGKVKFVKLDAEQAPGLADTYDIVAVPTFIVFTNGLVTNRTTGVMSKDALEKFLTPEPETK